MAKTAQTGDKASKATPAKVNAAAKEVAKDAKAAANTQQPAANTGTAQTGDKPAVDNKPQTNETKTTAAPVTGQNTDGNQSNQQEQNTQGAEKAPAQTPGGNETGELIDPNATNKESVTNEPDANAASAPVRDQAYLTAYGNYVQAYGELPNADLTTEQLVKFNDDAEAEKNKVASVAKTNEEKNTSGEVSDFNPKIHVMAHKDGQKKKFTKVTWDALKGSRDGWELEVQEPAEVQALKNKQ